MWVTHQKSFQVQTSKCVDLSTEEAMVKQCPKCGVCIKHATHYYRHVKRCGNDQHRAQCLHCEKTFSRNDGLVTKRFYCKGCKKPFAYEMALHFHEETCGKPKPKPFQCSFVGCGKQFCRKSTLEHHQQHVHLSQLGGGVKRKLEEDREKEAKKIKLPEKVEGILKADKEVSTMKGIKVDAFFYPKTETQRVDQEVFFKDTLPRLELHLQKVLKEKRALKWNLMYHCTLSMPDKYNDRPLRYSPYFRTPYPITSTYLQQLREQLHASMEVLEERMSTFMQAGSGWTLEENHALVLEMVNYEPMGGSSYLELPKDVCDTKAVIYIKNEDQECFKWSVLAALHPATHHAERISHYQPFKEELNFTGIDFPVTIDQVSKFEKLNPDMCYSHWY